MGNLVIICFGVNIFNPCPCCAADSSGSSDSSDSSVGTDGLIKIFLT